MGFLSDRQIKKRVSLPDSDPNRIRITEYSRDLVKVDRKPSWGQSCAGYDLRLSNQFKWLDAAKVAQGKGYVEPGDETPWITHFADFIIVPVGGFVLAMTYEWVRMPRDCLAVVMGKSTVARIAVDLNMTPLEPEWEGHITLEITNGLNVPIRLNAGDGICQVLFDRLDGKVKMSYADRKNPTYQNQMEVTVSKV